MGFCELKVPRAQIKAQCSNKRKTHKIILNSSYFTTLMLKLK
jgi:hypothetical protein